MSRFVFLDRDGTLTRDAGFTHRLADYALLPGVVRGLERLRDAGFRLAVVTNQSGIGLGRFGEADYRRFQARLTSDLAARGIEVDRSYHCPHRSEAGCACRKPAPGLLERARDELGADLATSWVIGDRASDAELARRAGCRGAVLVWPNAVAPREGGAPGGHGAPVASDLAAAAALVLDAEMRQPSG